MKRKPEQTSTGNKNYAVIYAELLAKSNATDYQDLANWNRVTSNKGSYKNPNEYYKAAYLALKADLATLSKKKQVKQPSFNDLAEKMLRLSEQQLERTKQQEKLVDELCRRAEEYFYKQPKKPGIIMVARQLLSQDLTRSQLN